MDTREYVRWLQVELGAVLEFSGECDSWLRLGGGVVRVDHLEGRVSSELPSPLVLDLG